jgi:hypothetical protein
MFTASYGIDPILLFIVRVYLCFVLFVIMEPTTLYLEVYIEDRWAGANIGVAAIISPQVPRALPTVCRYFVNNLTWFATNTDPHELRLRCAATPRKPSKNSQLPNMAHGFWQALLWCAPQGALEGWGGGRNL